jgi:hypothetical protein
VVCRGEFRRELQLVRIAQQRRAEDEREAVDRQAQHGEKGDFLARKILGDGIDPREHRTQSASGAGEKRRDRSRKEARTQQYAQARHIVALAEHDLARSPRRRSSAERRRGRQRLGGAVLELEACQPRIEAAASIEARMRPFLDDPALIHHDNSVGGAHGREAVRDDDRGAALHQPV